MTLHCKLYRAAKGDAVCVCVCVLGGVGVVYVWDLDDSICHVFDASKLLLTIQVLAIENAACFPKQ